jgi:hypothetical protein
MNDFAQAFRKASNIRLLTVVHSEPGEFAEEAVLAAKSELDARGLSKEELNELKNSLFDSKNKKSSAPEPDTYVEMWAETDTLDAVKLLKKEISMRKLWIVVIVFGAFWFVQLLFYSFLHFRHLILANESPDSTDFKLIASFVLSIIAMVTLQRKMSIGWVLSVFLGFYFGGRCFAIASSPIVGWILGLTNGYDFFDLESPFLWSILINVLLNVPLTIGFIWSIRFLAQSKATEFFSISNRVRNTTIIVGILVFVIRVWFG